MRPPGLEALLVDDEPLARSELARMLAVDGRVTVTGEASDADQAERVLSELEADGRAPDLLFLDVVMPGTPVFDWLLTRVAVPDVIFVTAHERFAPSAFRVEALDYLLKPIEDAHLAEAIGRATRRRRGVRPAVDRQAAGLPSRLFVKDGADAYLLDWADVRLIESVGNYVKLHADRRRPLAPVSLSWLEARLPPGEFFRANRAQIIALRFVARWREGPDGRLVAALDDGREVVLSVRRARTFRQRWSL